MVKVQMDCVLYCMIHRINMSICWLNIVTQLLSAVCYVIICLEISTNFYFSENSKEHIFPNFQRFRQQVSKFKVSLSYIKRPKLNKNKQFCIEILCKMHSHFFLAVFYMVSNLLFSSSLPFYLLTQL